MTDQRRQLASKVMIEIARSLRQRQTNTEIILWEALRARRLNNLKFRRQFAVPNTTYVVDFICHEHNLVVELDGSVHDSQREADTIRQQNLEALGLRVLRFRNERIPYDLENVLIEILTHTSASENPDHQQ